MKKETSVKEDTQLHKVKTAKSGVDKKYKELLKMNNRLAKERDVALRLTSHKKSHTIKAKVVSGKSESVAFALASDWHIDELVSLEQVNGMNEYTLAIAKKRADMFFRNTAFLVEVEQTHTKINTLVLGLIGDYISGNIHEEVVENSQLLPIDAIMLAQEWLVSGINFLLGNTKLNLVIPCVSGNHSRIVSKQRNATEHGNSLEYMMYCALRLIFKDEKRVKFIIPRAYHLYMEVYGKVLRFHHGNNIRYAGGVGGVTIPINKAIAQWNKLRKADFDLAGHMHQFIDGGNFIMNGSMIGYNAFALSIKASYEPPSQAFFCIEKDLGKTCVRPILFSKGKGM